MLRTTWWEEAIIHEWGRATTTVLRLKLLLLLRLGILVLLLERILILLLIWAVLAIERKTAVRLPLIILHTRLFWRRLLIILIEAVDLLVIAVQLLLRQAVLLSYVGSVLIAVLQIFIATKIILLLANWRNSKVWNTQRTI